MNSLVIILTILIGIYVVYCVVDIFLIRNNIFKNFDKVFEKNELLAVEYNSNTINKKGDYLSFNSGENIIRLTRINPLQEIQRNKVRSHIAAKHQGLENINELIHENKDTEDNYNNLLDHLH